jgi:hypothetical protein
MRRLVLVVALMSLLTGCKTSGFGIPSKFDGGNWDLADGLSKIAELTRFGAASFFADKSQR